jgi:hypothetical protein
MKLFRLGEPSRSQIYHLLAPISTEYLLYIMAKSRQEASKRFLSLYFTHLKHLKPELRGKDLIGLGFEPGPQIRDILNMLHEARIQRGGAEQAGGIGVDSGGRTAPKRRRERL